MTKPPARTLRNFETLQRAFAESNVELIWATRTDTGEQVGVICAVQTSSDPDLPVEYVPFAEMIDANPYERYEPPTSVV
jgi:hypothetical protein